VPAVVVVGLVRAVLLHWGQARRGAVERLDLAFSSPESDGMGGQARHRTNDVAVVVVDERGSVEEFELFHTVRSAGRSARRCVGRKIALMPTTLRIMAEVQWVASVGGAVWVERHDASV